MPPSFFHCMDEHIWPICWWTTNSCFWVLFGFVCVPLLACLKSSSWEINGSRIVGTKGTHSYYFMTCCQVAIQKSCSNLQLNQPLKFSQWVVMVWGVSWFPRAPYLSAWPFVSLAWKVLPSGELAQSEPPVRTTELGWGRESLFPRRRGRRLHWWEVAP